EPYRHAEIEDLPESDEPVSGALLDRARHLYGAYVEVLLSIANLPILTTLPSDPTEISFAIARTLQTDLFTKQALLEAPGPAARLSEEVRLLERDVERLQAFAAIHNERGYFFYRGKRLSLN
ncbi:MAG: hypothetical protein KGR26_13510, partial [Cyanobacteria bacterium REEB65]|nr:hypothetical protein [Cyanobacteria bacterium REEB65]